MTLMWVVAIVVLLAIPATRNVIVACCSLVAIVFFLIAGISFIAMMFK